MALILLTGAVSGCGGSGSGSNDVSVVDITSDARIINFGSGTVLAVNVSFDAERISNGEHLFIVVRLPPQVEYNVGTTEIDGLTTENDNAKTPILTNCASGEQFLAIDVSSVDLLQAQNPSGDADMRLNLSIQGTTRGIDAPIQATADDVVPAYACGQAFSAESEVMITVQ